MSAKIAANSGGLSKAAYEKIWGCGECTPSLLCLGQISVKASCVPAGVLVEVYATILHYAPCYTGPAGELFKQFGLCMAHIVKRVQSLIDSGVKSHFRKIEVPKILRTSSKHAEEPNVQIALKIKQALLGTFLTEKK